jgi:hypothetical protein
MKRISYDGHTIVTGSNTADALVRYAVSALSTGNAVAIDVPVLEENGSVRPHTLLLGPAAAVEIVDIDGHAEADEAVVFPVPEFPPLKSVGRALPKESVLDLDWTESA